jgi:hypothetical protein
MQTCEDGDAGCVHCAGRCTRDAVCVLFRVDMEDRTGTAFCETCSEDALASGLFRCPTYQEYRSTPKWEDWLR